MDIRSGGVRPVASGGTGATTAQGAAANLTVPYILYKGGIPFISLSSGSVAANGAISGITALPLAYPSAYCYFPANILATVKAAGFYYCTFSTTTAGVAFLDAAPASGVLTIPASPTAVTDGKGAFTGDTGEEFGITINVPALTANAAIRIGSMCSMNNNANVKTFRVRFSGNGGTIFFASALANLASSGFIGRITNTGATGKQISPFEGSVSAALSSFNVLGTIDTSVTTTLVLSLQKATATDNIVVLPPTVELLTDGT